MIIRTLHPADHAQAMALWRATPGIRLRDEDGVDGFCAYLARNPELSLGAFDDAVLVATLLVGHDGRRGYLQHLAVAETWRGQGIARVLLEEAARRLRAQGIHKTHVFVLREADEAVAFWSNQAQWQQRDDILVFSSEG